MVGGEASGVRGGREVREAEAVRSETASVCRKRSLRTGNIWKMHAGALEDGGGEGVCKSVYLHACVCAKRRRAIIRPQIVTLPSQKSPPPGPREDHGVELRRERLWPRSRTDAFLSGLKNNLDDVRAHRTERHRLCRHIQFKSFSVLHLI